MPEERNDNLIMTALVKVSLKQAKISVGEELEESINTCKLPYLKFNLSLLLD